MKATIYILSGFLGAGKTTLIQKLMEPGTFAGRVAIVENDFGEVGLDATLLRQDAVSVTELRSGCICCSLASDFVRALEELILRYAPDTILIEPSGVGRLTDVLNACAHPRVEAIARVQSAITVVDVVRLGRYLVNFGEFFEDQIRRADTILLSRVEQNPNLVSDALSRIIPLNSRANIIAQPWNELTAKDILSPTLAEPKKRVLIGHRAAKADQSAPAHTAEEIFDTVTLRTQRAFLPEELHGMLQEAEAVCGILIRAKGLLNGPEGSCLVQHTLGETILEETSANGGFLCLIGQGLNAPALNRIFLGE